MHILSLLRLFLMNTTLAIFNFLYIELESIYIIHHYILKRGQKAKQCFIFIHK